MQLGIKQPQRRRRAPQQIDLFAREPQNAIGNLPASSMLPKEIQVALTSLIPRLLLEHADGRRLAQWRRPIMTSDKVRLYHLERKAVLYVRQSSPIKFCIPAVAILSDEARAPTA